MIRFAEQMLYSLMHIIAIPGLFVILYNWPTFYYMITNIF